MHKIQLTEQELTELIAEHIFNILTENNKGEGFSFGTRGRNSDSTFRYTPGENDTNTNTRIFDESGKEKVNKILLPKSKVMSYNLYKITDMRISKALKHGDKIGIKQDQESIDYFFAKTALYIKHLLGNQPIDIITSPQSSSQFNKRMIEYLLRLYPKSEGIKFIDNLLTKNVRTVYVNTQVAKEIGLTDNEIHALQTKVDKWQRDEDLRDLRRKIAALESEIAEIQKNRGRGRPSKEYTNKVDLLNNYNQQLPLLRKGSRGKDGTVDNQGNIKDFQIKSVDDRQRRSIEGLFQINPQYKGIQQKLAGKVILVFDDNISSGATLDDICLTLQKLGVEKIIPVTLAVIPKTIYGAHERLS